MKEKTNKSTKKNWTKKILFSLCFLTLLSNNSMRTYAAEEDIVLEVLNQENLYDIIASYHLEEDMNYIFEYQSDFLKYYQATLENKEMTERDREIALKEFPFVHKYLYYDYSNQLEKIRNRKITIDDEKCQNRKAKGYFKRGTDDIYLVENATDEVRHHENIHHHLDFASGIIWGPIDINAISLVEAIASDIGRQHGSLDGFTTSYFELNTYLQGLHYIFGRETILKIMTKPDWVLKLYELYYNVGMTDKEVERCFAHLEELHSEKTKENFAQLNYNVSIDLIELYEKKTNQKWYNSLEMKTIIYCLNQKDFAKDKINETRNHHEELQALMEQKDFLAGIGLPKINGNVSVVIENQNRSCPGEFTIKYETFRLYETDSDIIYYTLQNETLISQKNYNSVWEATKTRLISYQIPETFWQVYQTHLSFFLNYEKYVLNSLDFTEEEQKNIINYFPKFINLHAFIFEQCEEGVDNYLFWDSLEQITSKEMFYQFLTNEECFYSFSKIRNKLACDGFNDFEDQNEVIKHLFKYDLYKSYIDNLIEIKQISLEDGMKIKSAFLAYYHSREELWNDNIYENISNDFQDVYNYEDFKQKISSKKYSLKLE